MPSLFGETIKYATVKYLVKKTQCDIIFINIFSCRSIKIYSQKSMNKKMKKICMQSCR